MFGLVRRLRQKRDHRWAQRLMSDYVDGVLSPRQRRRLDAHAHLCPECGPLTRALTVLVWELRELGSRPPGRSVAPGVIERLRREPSRSESRSRPTRP